MRRYILAPLLLLAISAFSQNQAISLDWAFVKQGPDGAPLRINFADKVEVAPGEYFKIFIHPGPATYAYLFLLDASGGLDLLYPASFSEFTAAGSKPERCFLPPGPDWFTLDGAEGTERFLLVATAQRLPEVEQAFTAWRDLNARQSSRQSLNAARQKLVDEISRLRAKHSKLASAAEKPVTIAGGSRGVNESVEKMATRIEAEQFYTRTFRLDH
jgi:hypothetical protein